MKLNITKLYDKNSNIYLLTGVLQKKEGKFFIIENLSNGDELIVNRIKKNVFQFYDNYSNNYNDYSYCCFYNNKNQAIIEDYKKHIKYKNQIIKNKNEIIKGYKNQIIKNKNEIIKDKNKKISKFYKYNCGGFISYNVVNGHKNSYIVKNKESNAVIIKKNKNNSYKFYSMLVNNHQDIEYSKKHNYYFFHNDGFYFTSLQKAIIYHYKELIKDSKEFIKNKKLEIKAYKDKILEYK